MTASMQQACFFSQACLLLYIYNLSPLGKPAPKFGYPALKQLNRDLDRALPFSIHHSRLDHSSRKIPIRIES